MRERLVTAWGYAKTSLEVLAGLPFSAFSIRSRFEIGERDKWRCRCGRGFKDRDGGYFVQAAHHTEFHDKSLPWYDDPGSGQIRCMMCHIQQHLDMGDVHSVRMLANHAWQNGLHKYDWLEKNPGTFDMDRMELVAFFTNQGLDAREYIDFSVE